MDKKEKISRLFGDYRAEWLEEDFDERFVSPPYFSDLESLRPLILFGGRGTGKTVSLKSLRYKNSGLTNISKKSKKRKTKYIAGYIRFNTNRVKAFGNKEDNNNIEWKKVFAHYFNLIVLLELSELSKWEQNRGRFEELGNKGSKKILKALFPGESRKSPNTFDELIGEIENSLIELQGYINNPYDIKTPNLSMAELPVKKFAHLMKKRDKKGRSIFLCIDEYENLYEYQQRVVNTYIKHSESPLSYKVGVRKNGFSTLETSGGGDLLTTPEDYAKVDLDSSDLSGFLEQVVNYRLNRAAESHASMPSSMGNFLKSLDWKEEARKLGAEDYAREVSREIGLQGDASLSEWAESLSVGELYFIKYWAESEGTDIVQQARDWYKNPTTWKDRINNYANASLFWITKNLKGSRTKKYYCGKNTFLKLSSGNVRYILELIDQTIKRYMSGDEREVSDGSLVMPPEIQTEAAKKVGERRLNQLEGRSADGLKLKMLVLTIGRVFFEYARSPMGHAPEKTTFVLSGRQEAKTKIRHLLEEGVAHLAFQSFKPTKRTDPAERKEAEYRLHPIYSPFFEFSHRKKRRVHFKAETLLEALHGAPKRAISNLLQDDMDKAEGESLPSQLQLFSDFYE